MKYKIGDVSRILGISTETLRFFEKKGIVIPEKNKDNSYRYYDTLDLNKLVAYKFFRSMEFSLDQSIEMLQTFSHTESIDEINCQIDMIQNKAKHYEALLERMKGLKASYERVEAMENNFRIENSPEILLYYNQVNDVFGMDKIQRETTKKWINFMPFIWLALHIPKSEIPSGAVVHWGYALETKYESIVLQLDSVLTKRIPSQRSIYTIFKSNEGEPVEPKIFKSALSFMEENNLKLNGDAIGCIINEELNEFGLVRYFEVWLPVADKQ